MFYKKTIIWLICIVILVAIVAVACLFTILKQSIDIPEPASVLSVEIEQFHDHKSVAHSVITDVEQIEEILSALSGARKTLRQSVTDYPTTKSYFVVRLILKEQMRTLCLYSEGRRYFIEEPYVGVYSCSKHVYDLVHEVFEKVYDNHSVQNKQENETENEIPHGFDEEVIIENSERTFSKKDVIEMVGKIDPYQLKPAMSSKEIYELRTAIYSEIPQDKVRNFTYAIDSCATQLAGIVTDNRYVDLVEKDHPRWDEYDNNNLFGVADVLSGIEMYIDYPPLLDDIKTARTLCIEGLKERNILKIIDANRILQDLSRHFIHVPYRGEGEEMVDYGDTHNIYFKATKTLEGCHNLLSDFD